MDIEKLNELRNFHVKKLLNHLGGHEVAPYLQKSIKRSYSEFTEDISIMEDSTHDGQNDKTGRLGI